MGKAERELKKQRIRELTGGSEQIDLKDFLNDVKTYSNDKLEENFEEIANTQSIQEWEIIHTKDKRGNYYPFLMLKTSEEQYHFSLSPENVESLLTALIKNTPDLNRDNVPLMIPMEQSWFSKYRWQVIFAGALALLLVLSVAVPPIIELIAQAQLAN